MEISTEVSNKIRNISFICALLVVLIHVPPIENGLWLNDFVLHWIKEGLSMIAVPVFFIISGFLLGKHINEQGWYGKAVKSRIKSLVIPFFVLNILYYPVFVLLHYIGVKYFGADGSNHIMDLTLPNALYLMGCFPWGGNAIGPLWYLRALFYLVLISPVLTWGIKKGRLIALAFIMGLLLVWCVQGPDSFLAGVGNGPFAFCRLTFNVSCPVYFAIGLACSQYAPKALPRYAAFIVIPLALVALIVYQQGWFSGKELKALMSFVTTTLLALALWCITPKQKWPVVFTANTFPIYALHNVILYFLPIPLKMVGAWNGILRTVGILPIFVITVLISIGIAKLVKRHNPTFSRLAFGGR